MDIVTYWRDRATKAEDERDEARKLLTQCWNAAGLLSERMTGVPGQAWEEPSDLVAKIEELASKADACDEAEAAQDDAEKERDSARTTVGRVLAALSPALQSSAKQGSALAVLLQARVMKVMEGYER